MKFDEFQEWIKNRWHPLNDDKFFTAALGVGEEAGEVQGRIKKIHRDGSKYKSHAEQQHSLKEEMGDTLHYLLVLIDWFQFDIEEIMQINVNKLQEREKRGWSIASGPKRG